MFSAGGKRMGTNQNTVRGRGIYSTPLLFLPLEWFMFVPEFLARPVQLYGVPRARLLGRAPPLTTLVLLCLVLLGTLGILIGRGRQRFMLQGERRRGRRGTPTGEAAAHGP